MSGAIARAREIAQQTPGAFLPNQFSNPVNPRAHYETTGPEIAARSATGSTRGWPASGRPARSRASRATCARAIPGSGASRSSRRARSSEAASAGAAPGRGRRPLLLSGHPRPRPHRRGDHDRGRRGLRDVPAAGARGRTPGRRAPRASPRRPPCGSPGASGPGKTVVTLFPDGAERYPGQGIFENSCEP